MVGRNYYRMLKSYFMLAHALSQGFLVLSLILANAFFVSAEFSLVSLRETRLQQLLEEGRAAARAVQRLHQNLDEVLSSVQLGVTLTSLALGWVGEPAFALFFEGLFPSLTIAPIYLHTLALAVAFL